MKIKIHPTFYVALLLVFFLGYMDKFLLLFAIVTIHELTHALAAALCRIRVTEIVLMPIGEMAVLKNATALTAVKKYFIFLSGPFINILWGTIIASFFDINPFFYFLMTANFCIGFFNLLPFYPMDGGKIFFTYLANKIGYLNSLKIVAAISKLAGVFMMVTGIAQMILFPYNASLLLAGIYVLHVNKKDSFNMIFDFYRNLIKKKSRKTLLIKNIAVSGDVEIKKIVSLLAPDFYYIFYIMEFDEQITEKNLVDYIMEYGLKGNVEQLLAALAPGRQ